MVASAAQARPRAARAFFGCQAVTRRVARYDDINDLLVLLGANTHPGMTPASLVSEQAARVGIPLDQFVLRIVEDAYARCSAGGTA